jgi:peptidoglycan hydrolase CwlO-like protein
MATAADSLNLWSSTFEELTRQKSAEAHVVELQEQNVEQAIADLEKAEVELERARFSLTRAKAKHAELVMEMNPVTSPPRLMYKELHSRLDKVLERMREVTEKENAIVALEKKIDEAQEQLAFDKYQQEKTTCEIETVTKRIAELSANTVKS